AVETEIHDRKALLRGSRLERREGLGIRCKPEAEVAAPGAADLINDAEPPGGLGERAMLRGHDVGADRPSQRVELAAVLIDCAQEVLAFPPLGRRAAGLGNLPKRPLPGRRLLRFLGPPTVVTSQQVGRRRGPAGKNSRESYTVRKLD